MHKIIKEMSKIRYTSFCECGGMGGHHFGETASYVVCAAIGQLLRDFSL